MSEKNTPSGVFVGDARDQEDTASEGFIGTVSLYDAVLMPNGVWTRAVHGHVSIEPATVTGMEPARGDSQWVAKVSGEKETVWIPGCKVLLVTQSERRGGEVWKVE